MLKSYEIGVASNMDLILFLRIVLLVFTSGNLREGLKKIVEFSTIYRGGGLAPFPQKNRLSKCINATKGGGFTSHGHLVSPPLKAVVAPSRRVADT